ncbi:MAG TPA: histidinol-phosphate transaminase [Bacillaceae bacterium]
MKVKEQLLSLTAYAPGKTTEEVKREYGLDKIVKLASNENPYGCSPAVQEAITGSIPSYAIYPDGGAKELRAIVAQHLGIEEDQLIFSAGLDEMIQMLSRALLDENSNTVMAKNTFPQYRHHATIEKAEIREVPLKDGRHDLEKMAKQIDEMTKIVWICNPNNPTGTYTTAEELENFMACVPGNVLVVMDEAYYEFVTAKDYPQTIPLLEKYRNIMILRTFSKAYGLAAFRIGYGIGESSFLKQLEVARLPFNTSSLAQAAAIAALQDLEFVEECVIQNVNELDRMYEIFNKLGIEYYPSQGNFVFIQVPGKTSKEVFQHLIERGFIVRPFPDGVRITVGTDEDNEKLLKVMEEMILVTL